MRKRGWIDRIVSQIATHIILLGWFNKCIWGNHENIAPFRENEETFMGFSLHILPHSWRIVYDLCCRFAPFSTYTCEIGIYVLRNIRVKNLKRWNVFVLMLEWLNVCAFYKNLRALESIFWLIWMSYFVKLLFYYH